MGPELCQAKNVCVPFGVTSILSDRETVPDTDTVTLGLPLVIQDQSIGVATSTQGFEGIDGILGKA